MFSLKSFRKFFFSQLKGDVLEIGPFNRLVVKNARYFDTHDKNGPIESTHCPGLFELGSQRLITLIQMAILKK
jgi:hypothetical protein